MVDPLPDPFMWSNGKGRSKNFRDWERRRNEIKAEIEYFEIGTLSNSCRLNPAGRKALRRIALTIAQESGGGGAPAWRVSETIGDVEKLGATSHEWFQESMFQFAGLNVSKLPYDHHELMAMVAPCPFTLTSTFDRRP